MNVSSQITFLYFEDLPKAKEFFEKTLGLKPIFDPTWAIVYEVTEKAFLGAVDASEGSIRVKNRGGVLISLTVNNIEEVYERFTKLGVDVTSIKKVKGIDLKSFFFTGPEGYDFEIQQFTSEELQAIF